jgi:hypothetical protein
VVGEDTHLSGLCGDVDLNNILGLVDRLRQLARLDARLQPNWHRPGAPVGNLRAATGRMALGGSYLVGESQAQLDLWSMVSHGGDDEEQARCGGHHHAGRTLSETASA